MLRAYRREDLTAMVELDRLCFDASFQFSRATMRRFAEGRRCHTVVAENGSGGIDGFVLVERPAGGGGGMAYCVTLDVAEQARRHGLGRRLLQEAERWAEEEGASGLGLHVWVENAGAIRFYERLGYTHWTDVPEFYGGPGMDARVYGKVFPG